MINALHLIWIIPLAASAGAFCMALVAAAAKGDKQLQNAQELPTQDNRGVPGLLYDKDCPFGYKCLAVDCMECMEMYAAQQGENNTTN